MRHWSQSLAICRTSDERVHVLLYILQTNVSGTFTTLIHAVHLMNENEGNDDGQRGVIINTSSVAAFDGQIGQ